MKAVKSEAMAKLRQQEVLNLLRPVWVDALGIDEYEVSVCPEENLIDWLKALGLYEELDFADVIYRLHRQFGLKASSDEFREFFEGGATSDEEWERAVKPALTLGRFADWIVERTPSPSYAALRLLGTPCQEAGIFLAIQDIVRDVFPYLPAFGPSTEILRLLKGRKLDCVWSRLRFHSAGSLPELGWPFARCGSLLALAGCAGALISIFFVGHEPVLSGIAFCIACAFVALGLKVARIGNPLPINISTFKDLSREMAKALKA